MACWPTNLVIVIFLALLIFDIVEESYKAMPIHAAIGIVLSGVLWGVCSFAGEGVASAVLLVPVIFAATFLFTVWLTGKSLENRGCCVQCSGGIGPNPNPDAGRTQDICTARLNATPLV